MRRKLRRRLTDSEARFLLLVGIGLLPVAFGLALYAVPSGVPGLPDFPFFSLSFPLLSLLMTLSTSLMAMGSAFDSRGSLAKVMIAAASFIVAGLIAKAISFVTAIPFNLGGLTIYVEPYGAHAFMLILVGPLLAFFGLFFWALDRAERWREERAAEPPASSKLG